jgi:hypothetical protein
MPDFQIQFEWETSPRDRAPELDATWARLEIRAGSEAITKVEVQRTQSVREGIYVPLFPIAEWAVANWWFLWEEWRAPESDPRHSLLEAREGFPLPNLTLRPTETRMELRWKWSTALASGLIFLSDGSRVVDKIAVKEEFRRLVDAVVQRLADRGAGEPDLVEEWRAIQEAERDPEQLEFCRQAARLGCNPFAIERGVADELERLGRVLPDAMIGDFCNAVDPHEMAKGAAEIAAFLRESSNSAPAAGRWAEMRDRLWSVGKDVPWRDGYREARELRREMRAEGPFNGDLTGRLAETLGSFEVREIAVPSRVDGIAASGETAAPVFGFAPREREEQRRFTLCRALADALVSGQPWLVTRGRSEHQQRNRAFAAEFLAPAESIRERITADSVGEEDIEDLAHEFRVSDLVIRHQIQNHNLAWLGA